MYHSPSVNSTLIFKGIDWIVKCGGKLMFDNHASTHCAINNKKFGNIKKIITYMRFLLVYGEQKLPCYRSKYEMVSLLTKPSKIL